MAHKYIGRYLSTAARFYRAPEIRQRISMHFREIGTQAMTMFLELDRPSAKAIDQAKRMELKLQCLDRMQSAMVQEARLFGFGTKIDITLSTGTGEVGRDSEQVLPVPDAETRRVLRGLVRMQRSIVESGEHVPIGEMRKLVEATFSEKGGVHDGPPVEGPADEVPGPDADADAHPDRELDGLDDDVHLRGV
jgi:hypothetical protein